MSSPTNPFAATVGTFKLDVCMILAVFSVIDTVTATPWFLVTKADLADYAYSYSTPGHNRTYTQQPSGVITQAGHYKVHLPDGRIQIVTYTADERGYRAVVTNETTSPTVASANVKGATSVSNRGVGERSPACNTLPSPGECRGAFPRVFFNSTSSQCDCFLWGGCDDEETTSSWLSLEDCSATCIPDNTKPGPRCKIANEPETQTFVEPPKPIVEPPKPNIAEVPDTMHLNDTAFLEGLVAYEKTSPTVASANVKGPASVSDGGVGERSPDCNTLPSPGECRGAFPRVFFNSTSSQCDCFLWGGCDDEKTTSSWLTLDDCSASCIPDNKEPGPRCKIAEKQEVQTFVTPPQPNIAEVPDTAHLNDTDFLQRLVG